LNGYIDMHAHILPGVDHGSDSVETSLEQLYSAEKAGVSVIAATPHYYPDRIGAHSFFERRDAAVYEIMEEYSGCIEILPGAEVYLCEGMQNHPRLNELCIKGTSVILIEMPSPPWSQRYVQTLEGIEDRGYRVLLAHVERYPAKNMNKLFELGFVGQFNAESLRNPFLGRQINKLIDNWSTASPISLESGADQIITAPLQPSATILQMIFQFRSTTVVPNWSYCI